MFGKIAGFEFRYQVRQPVFWVAVAIFFLMTFFWQASDFVRIGDSANVHKNSPYAIGTATLVLGFFYMFITTAFVANVIVRDDETGFGPLIRSTRISKFDYLYGRFTGAFGAAALSFVAVPAGILAGSMMPWVDKEALGPTNLYAFLYAYVVLGLPAVFLTSTLFFALATVSRSLMWTYVGVIGLLVIWGLYQVLLGRPEYMQVAALWDPMGNTAFRLVTRYWTAAERNTLTPALEGVLLFNRLFSLALGGAFLASAHGLFRFGGERASAKGAKQARLAAAAPPEPAGAPVAAAPRIKGSFGLATAWSQLAARTRLDLGQVFGSPVYIVLMGMGLFNSLLGLWFTVQAARYGGSLYPVTRSLLPVLEGSFSLIPMIIAIFYAGELVWRERDKKTHEIVDATPVPDWAFIAPKTLAIVLVLISTLAISVLAAMLIQLANGFTRFELDKYILWYVLPQALDWTLLAVLAVFFQVLSPHKFIGWGLMVLYMIVTGTLASIGAEDNLYIFGGVSAVPLSDMNRMGRFWVGAWWFRLYWSAFSVVLLVLGYALWRRGTESRLMPRLRRLPRRLRGPAGGLGLAAAVVFAGAGAFIFLNTHVWNEFRTTKGDEKLLADLERDLIRYENTPQPTITAVTLDVDLYPHEPRVTTKGRYTIVNKTGEPLREVHVYFANRDLQVVALNIEGAFPDQQRRYDRYNYRIFRFATPMLPGETRTMAFISEIKQRGFRNRDNQTRVVDNGSFLNNAEIAPFLGFSRSGLLDDRRKRKEQKLEPVDLRMPKLGAPGADRFNYLRHDSAWVAADITVTTDADQTPIAPGYAVSQTVTGGRRTVRFVSDTPIMNFFSIQSARYAVKRDSYKGIALSVYYDPQHPWNVDRMIEAQKATLDYAQASFSPYQFRHVRYLEFPDYVQFAQAFAGTIPWSEGLFFISNYKDPERIDMVTYVGAHEIGHQWWAHQIIGADEQGSTSLSETLAQYTAMMVMKRKYGDEQVVKFLKFELDSYLRARGGDALEETPLARVENQPHIHYRKGSLVMYRLQDELGEDAVNRALRSLIQTYGFKGPPFPTSRDLVAALRAVAPADKQQLITDLFERITLYDVKTKGVKVRKRADGRYDVTLTVDARKMYADGKGKETPAALSENMYIGLFTAKPGKKAFGKSSILYLEKRPIHSGLQTLTFVTDKAPTWGGIDPYNILIDRNSDDNLLQAN